MKTSDFRKKLTSSQLKENMNKMFGVNVNISKYSREQLEDMRNKLRTKVFQQEGRVSINDLLTNETYQKDKAMLDLLNTRIKEMLGEQMQKLRDKMAQLSEGKKVDQNKDGKNDFKDVQIARLKASGATKDTKVKEEFPTVADAQARAEKEKTTGKFDKKPNPQTGGTIYTKKHTKADADPEKKIKEVKMSDLPSKTVKGKSYGNQSDYKKPPEDARRPATTMPAKKDKKPLGEDDAHPKDCDCKECMGTMEGKDEGKPGKMFKKIAKDAGKRYGSKEAGERVAGKIRANKAKAGTLEESNFKHNVRFVNESLDFLLQEDEEGKAKAITSAGDMVNNFTSWMQRVGQYQTKTLIELADAIKADFGAQEAEAFKAAIVPALSSTLEMLTQQREAISNAVAVLAGEATADMGMGMEPGMDMSAPDEMNPEPAGDEFGAADAAAGAGTTGREIRENTFSQKLQESHNIISALAK